MNKLNNGLKDADNGANTLSDGASLFYNSLSDGSAKIAELVNGSRTFYSGFSTLNSGLNHFNAGVAKAAPQITQLAKGTSDFNNGLQSFTFGINNFIASVNKATEAQSGLAAYIQKYAASHPEAMKDPNFKAVVDTLQASKSAPEQIKAGGEQLSSAAKALSDGSGKLAGGVSQLSNQLGSVSKAIAQLSAGSNQLYKAYPRIDGGIKDTAKSTQTASLKSKELASGAEKLAGGVSALSDGGRQLADNSGKLLDGETQIQAGLGKLKNGVTEASSGVSSSLLKADDQLNGTDGLKEYIADPVKLTEKKVYGIPDYGTAFTPYFVSLSLWVGALLMFFAIYLDPDVKFRRISTESKGLLRFFAYTFIGIAQALVLDIVILNALHLHVANVGLFVLTSIIISLSFTSIMRFLLVQLRDVGKFIAILLLILQLTSCGGTFPMELVPHFFDVINPFMPMTYSVNALKEVISGISDGFLTQNLVVLVSIIAAFLILNLIVSKLRFGSLVSDSKEPAGLTEEISA
ncbi:MAG TPA: YhgE/Pip domain-containing protein [Ruminiclostridium sp.]|nr:YhgE/Pip domain-containing protein [Ruminiclostridium sp.]